MVVIDEAPAQPFQPYPSGMTTRVLKPVPLFDQRDQQHTRAAVGALGAQVQERWTAESVDPFRRVLFPDTRPQNSPMRSWVPIADGPINPVQVPVDDPAKMTDHIKEVARFFGARMVGVCAMRPEFVYSRRGLRIDHHKGRWGEPVTLDHAFAISIAQPMDHHRLKFSPSFIDGAEVGLGYLETAKVVVALACYIRELGYRAKAHFQIEEQVLQVPIAIAAGLGELARNNILITREFGPRVRLATVTTDLPLSVDKPVDFGVQAYCDICDKCAKWCPSQAIPDGPKTMERGYEHWVVDNDKCMTYWTRNRDRWNDCARCITVCPWNKPPTWGHQAALRLLHIPAARRLHLWLDDRFYPARKLIHAAGGWLHYTRKTSAKGSPTGQIIPPT